MKIVDQCFSRSVRQLPDRRVETLFSDCMVKLSHAGKAEQIIHEKAQFSVAFVNLVLLPLRFTCHQGFHLPAFIIPARKAGQIVDVQNRPEYRLSVVNDVIDRDVRKHGGEQCQGKIYIVFVRIDRDTVLRKIKDDGVRRVIENKV